MNNHQKTRHLYIIEKHGIRWVTPYKTLTAEPTDAIAHAAMVELAKATLEEVAPAFLEIADAYGMAILLGRGPSIEIAVPAGGGAFRTVPLPEVAQSMAARSAGVSVQSLHIDEFDNTPPAARH